MNIKTLEEYNDIAQDGKTVFILCYRKDSVILDNLKELDKELNLPNFLLFNISNDSKLKKELNIKSYPVLLHIRSKNIVKSYSDFSDINLIRNIVLGKRVKASVAKPQTQTTNKKVTVYYTPNCPWCKALMTYLQENNISYRKINVSTVSKIESLTKKSRLTGVPQTEIDGKFIVGFDAAKLDKIFK